MKSKKDSMTKMILNVPDNLVESLISEAENRNYGHGMDAFNHLLSKCIHSHLGEKEGKYRILNIKKNKNNF